jgi:hypothetical protein
MGSGPIYSARGQPLGGLKFSFLAISLMKRFSLVTPLGRPDPGPIG